MRSLRSEMLPTRTAFAPTSFPSFLAVALSISPECWILSSCKTLSSWLRSTSSNAPVFTRAVLRSSTTSSTADASRRPIGLKRATATSMGRAANSDVSTTATLSFSASSESILGSTTTLAAGPGASAASRTVTVSGTGVIATGVSGEGGRSVSSVTTGFPGSNSAVTTSGRFRWTHSFATASADCRFA